MIISATIFLLRKSQALCHRPCCYSCFIKTMCLRCLSSVYKCFCAVSRRIFTTLKKRMSATNSTDSESSVDKLMLLDTSSDEAGVQELNVTDICLNNAYLKCTNCGKKIILSTALLGKPENSTFPIWCERYAIKMQYMLNVNMWLCLKMRQFFYFEEPTHPL